MPIPAWATVTPSLFDRLTDYDPARTKEIPAPEQIQKEDYKASVARDLGELLNTRCREDDIPERYERARESVIAYGLPDFTSESVDHEALREAIERVVRAFEPRLSHVEVLLEAGTAKSKADQLRFRFTFQIAAVLRMQTGSEAVLYDAVLPKEIRRFQVKVAR
jgi:type VI secretion system protein ImpF